MSEIEQNEQTETSLPADKSKHAGGRPRILQSVEAAEALIDLYFKQEPDKPTMCGLALYLGFVDRCSLLDYIARDDEFSAPIKIAISRIEQKHEARMYEGQPAGSIFWLKNRKWTDSHDVTSGGEAIRATSVNIIAPPGADMAGVKGVGPEVDS